MEQIFLAQTRRKQDLEWLQAALALSLIHI